MHLRRAAGVLAWALLVAGLGQSALDLRFNNDHWLPPEHPVSRDLDRLGEEFEAAESILVVLPLPAPYFSSPPTRQSLARLEARLVELPLVAKATSALTAQSLIPKGDDELRIATYEEMLAEGTIDADEWRADFLQGPYAKRLLSEDGRLAALHLELEPSLLVDQQAEAAGETKAIARAQFRRRALEDVEAVLAASEWRETARTVGDASLKAELDRILGRDLVRLLGLGLLVSALGLWASTRSLRRGLFVTAVCGGCVAAALGVMGMLQTPFTATSLVLPLLVLVVTVADSLHVLARWDWERGRSGDDLSAWRGTLRKTYAPCLVASLTTAAGCFSFEVTRLLALRDFARDASLGILCAYPLLLLPIWGAMRWWPALLAPAPLGGSADGGGEEGAGTGGLVSRQRAANLTAELRRPRWLAVWGGVTLAFAAALPMAHSESNFLHVFFAPDSATRQGFDQVDGRLGGSGVLDLILEADGDSAEYFRSLDGRDRVLGLDRRLRAALDERGWLRDVDSYLTPLQVAHRGLEGEGERAGDDATLAQELFFLDLSQSESDRGVLQPWLTFDGGATRMRLVTPNLTSRQLDALEAEVAAATAGLQEQGIRTSVTGPAHYVRYLSSLVFESQGKAGAFAILLIGVLLLAQLGWRWGLVGLAVNVPPLAITLGAIVWLGLPFDFGTILVTSLTLGLVVDSSLHLFSSARRLAADLPLDRAFGEAIRETLPPILRATGVITAGLLVLWTSELVLIQRFAALSILGIWVGCLSAFSLPLALLYLRGQRAE